MGFIKRYFLLVLVGTALVACSQQKNLVSLSPSTQELVNQIKADNYIGTETIGRNGGPSEAYERRQKLMNSASQSELEGLVYHDNPVVSLTAFQGLCEQLNDNIPLYLQSVYGDDKRKVMVIQGDIAKDMYTLEYAYGYLLGLPYSGKTGKEEAISPYKLSPELSTILRSKLELLLNSSRKVE